MKSPLHLDWTTTGEGPSLVLIHAFPMNHSMWDGQVASLRTRYRIHAPDLPGFGRSPASRGWQLGEVADAVLAIDNLDNRVPFGVLGLSMGTYAALEIYRRAPDRVRFLVLANGRARADSPPEREARTAMMAEVRTHGLGALSQTLLPRLLGPRPAAGMVDRIKAALEATTPEAVADALGALRDRRDSTDLLERIQCPTLVVAADSDPITTSEECAAMARTIPHSRFAEIPNAGHLSNIGNPEAFNRALDAFLETV